MSLPGARMLWMTQRRFAWALRARGSALADWPASERNAAVCLLRRSPVARELLAEALTNEDAPSFDALALERITFPVQRALAPITPIMRGLRWGAVVACLAAGIYLGVLRTDTDAAMDAFTALFSTTPAPVLAALDQ